MDIIKNLKDYKLSTKQRIFAGYLNDKISSYTCSEHITNRAYLRRYFSPDNDFLVYSTAVSDVASLRYIQPPYYDEPEEQVG
ncbi:MAG: hypothetical protein ACI4SM_02935 [Candidatus Gastranaerophilaceae bacterium]